MGIKYILLSIIIILIVIVSTSLIIIENRNQENPQYKTFFVRDYKINSYELRSEYKKPRSAMYNRIYTKLVHEHFEKVNLAKDRIRIEQKIKDLEYTS